MKDNQQNREKNKPEQTEQLEQNSAEEPMVDSETSEDSLGIISVPSKINFLTKIKANRTLMVAIIGVVVLIFGFTVFYIYNSNADKNVLDQSANQQIENTAETGDEQTTGQTTHVEENSWKDGTELPHIAIFDRQALIDFYWNGEDYGGLKPEDNMGFYDIGTSGGKRLIMLDLHANSPGPNGYIVMVEDVKDKSYRLLTNHMSGMVSQDNKYVGPKVTSIAKIDSTTKIDELVIPKTFNHQGVVLNNATGWSFSTKKQIQEYEKNIGGTITKIDDYASGEFQEIIYDNNGGGIKSYQYRLELNSGIVAYYSYSTDVLKDDRSMKVSWKDGTSTNDTYSWFNISRGCGFIDKVEVLDKKYFSALIARGTAQNGTTIYELNSATHEAVKTAYTTYAGSEEYRREDAVSISDFYKDHGIVFAKNGFGYYVALSNEKFQRNAECAKPVIYLYPKQLTKISVKLGADVRQSNPEYKDGWTVWAFPNGTLIHKEGLFDSLFWDGQGHGRYPEIYSGFIVKSDDIEKTLLSHLSRLGLNQQESSDFMGYWLPLMPSNPYVRLTWFGTAQMNELAPLRLSEKPDTLIRVFLDYEGLDQPINIPTQKLSAPERKGFTVIEWGGLKIGQ